MVSCFIITGSRGWRAQPFAWFQLCSKVKWKTRFYYAILCNPGLYVPGNAPFLFFAANKTDSGAYDLPLYLTFADPMNTPGLMLAPSMAKGFKL